MPSSYSINLTSNSITDKFEKVPGDGSFLGKGSFGHVEKCRRTEDSKILARKTVVFGNIGTSKAKSECEILQTLDHPNIVQLVEVDWEQYQVKIYMEYCEGGSLQDLIDELTQKKTLLSEKHVWTIGHQLASALLYCHTGIRIDGDGNPSSDRSDWKTILHRDIKPANVFIKNRSETALNSIRLGDFGLGYVLRNDKHPGTYVGTSQFLAPEISRRSRNPIVWTPACDVFSFGCTLYALCKLEPPFANHLEAEPDSYPQIPGRYTSQLRDLITSCLSFSPEARPLSALHLFQQCQPCVPCSRDNPTPVQPNTTVQRPQASRGINFVGQMGEHLPSMLQQGPFVPSEGWQKLPQKPVVLIREKKPLTGWKKSLTRETSKEDFTSGNVHKDLGRAVTGRVIARHGEQRPSTLGVHDMLDPLNSHSPTSVTPFFDSLLPNHPFLKFRFMVKRPPDNRIEHPAVSGSRLSSLVGQQASPAPKVLTNRPTEQEAAATHRSDSDSTGSSMESYTNDEVDQDSTWAIQERPASYVQLRELLRKSRPYKRRA